MTVCVADNTLREKLLKMPLKRNSIVRLLDVTVVKKVVLMDTCDIVQLNYDKVIGSPKRVKKKDVVVETKKEEISPLPCPGCGFDLSEFGENMRHEHIRHCCSRDEEEDEDEDDERTEEEAAEPERSKWSEYVEPNRVVNKNIDKEKLALFNNNKSSTKKKKNSKIKKRRIADIQQNKINQYCVADDGLEIFDDGNNENVFTSTTSNTDTKNKRRKSSYIEEYQNDDSNTATTNGKPTLSARAHFALKQVFGHESFRGQQKDIVLHASRRTQDTFVLMPTGGGKSLCFQLPALLSRGVSVVISPLLSLIQDQVTALIKLGIPTACFDAALGKSRAKAIYRELYREPEPYMKILYVTPEKLHKSEPMWECLRELNERGALARFVIDEAHCVSQWGHDFRTSYKKLSRVRREFRDIPIMALTATATPDVQTDIRKILRMRPSTRCFKASFDRPNLRYSVLSKPSKKFEAMEMLCKRIEKRHKNQTGIVYCLSRDECSMVARYLVSQGLNAEPYHAGMTTQERTRHQIRWQNGNCDVICATIAYGMGIDKADVRYVYHFCIPKSIEGYYQESGRAGRDGKVSDCVIYFSQTDAGRLKRMFKRKQPGTNRRPSAQQIERNMNALEHVVKYCKDNTSKCRRVQLLSFFHERFNPINCRVKCDHCSSSPSFSSSRRTNNSSNSGVVVIL